MTFDITKWQTTFAWLPIKMTHGESAGKYVWLRSYLSRCYSQLGMGYWTLIWERKKWGE